MKSPLPLLLLAAMAMYLPFYLHAEPPAYTLIVDGKQIQPRLLTTEGKTPVAGDVAVFGGAIFCLDEPGLYRLETKEDSLWRLDEDGKKRLVACEIIRENNPLAALDNAALKQLRGIVLDTWPPGIEKRLARLDLTRVCICLTPNLASEKKDALARLPAGTMTLILHSGGNWVDRKPFAALKKMKKLRFLDMQESQVSEFDSSILTGLPLEYLSLPYFTPVEEFGGKDAFNVAALETLTTLKTFNASNCSDYIGNGAWITRLKNLRQLYVSGFAFTCNDPTFPPQDPLLDLAGLAELPQLAVLKANGRRFQSLPTTTLPALQNASLLISTIPQDALEAFAKANPQADIFTSLNAALQKTLVGADRLQIRSGESTEPLYETRDRAKIAEVLRCLVVREGSIGGCMCAGDPALEFYVGEKHIARVGVKHGFSLYWPDGWPGDGGLTEESAEALDTWLAKHGAPGPQEERAKAKARAAEQEKALSK